MKFDAFPGPLRLLLLPCMLLLFLLFNANHLYAQYSPIENRTIVLLKPTGKKINDLPEMVRLSDTSLLVRTFNALADSSVISDFLAVHGLIQTYLANQGKQAVVEPAYLALTEHEGGFARKGFYLLEQNKHLDHTQSFYVDIIRSRLLDNPNRLMSITQLYPHELGHVLYRLLSSVDSVEPTGRHVDVHYFSIMTDYGTAFNEGFSEHLENVCRQFEPNAFIRKGIFEDMKRVRSSSPRFLSGFERDMSAPWRLGYYKTAMPAWYGQYEDLKRHDHAVQATVRYCNAIQVLQNVEDMLTYRNAGIRLDSSTLRNRVQLFATEGFVNAFFTRLSYSELGARYLPDSFYLQFLPDTFSEPVYPEKRFKPWVNQFLKYAYVLHHYVRLEHSTNAQFVDFLNGYQEAFPEERATVLAIFEAVAGQPYKPDLPPELWLMIDGHKHRILVLDAWGTLTVPVYTFNLNAAQVVDLMTVPGMDLESAQKIIDYRDKQGFFYSLEDLRKVPGLDTALVSEILRSALKPEVFEGVEEPELSISTFLIGILKNFLFRVLIFAGLAMLAVWLLFRRDQVVFSWKTIAFLLTYTIYGLLLASAGLFLLVATKQPVLYFMGILALISVLVAVLLRHKRTRLFQFLLFSGLMGLWIGLSLY